MSFERYSQNDASAEQNSNAGPSSRLMEQAMGGGNSFAESRLASQGLVEQKLLPNLSFNYDTNGPSSGGAGNYNGQEMPWSQQSYGGQNGEGYPPEGPPQPYGQSNYYGAQITNFDSPNGPQNGPPEGGNGFHEMPWRHRHEHGHEGGGCEDGGGNPGENIYGGNNPGTGYGESTIGGNGTGSSTTTGSGDGVIPGTTGTTTTGSGESGVTGSGATTATGSGDSVVSGANNTGNSATAAQDSTNSVVKITANEGGTNESIGTGFFVGSNGLIATDDHVVQGAQGPLQITLANGQTVEANVVVADQANDLAVLQVAGTSNQQFTPLQLSSQVTSGANYTAIGFPEGGPLAEQTGQYAGQTAFGALNVSDNTVADNPNRSLLQFANMDTQPGSSGSPVFDSSGQVVGLVDLGNGAGTSYATPISALTADIAQAQSQTQSVG